jgi:hypothetical protein
MEHRQLHRDPRYKPMWDMLYANELGRLCQGIGTRTTPNTKQVAGTNTFFLINYNDIPVHRHVICKVCPEKDNPNCTQITIEGSQICYPGDVGTNTASLELVKILLNSVLSWKGAHFSTIDLKKFYLDTPMPDPEYVCIKTMDIPDKSILEYNLLGCDRDGWVYFEICQGCCGPLSLEFWPTIFFVHDWSQKDSTNPSPPQDFGVTNGIPSNSASSSMILVWNTWGSSTSIFSSIFSKSTMGYNSTWLATNSQASPSNGIIQANAAKSACQGT